MLTLPQPEMTKRLTCCDTRDWLVAPFIFRAPSFELGFMEARMLLEHFATCDRMKCVVGQLASGYAKSRSTTPLSIELQLTPVVSVCLQ